MGFLYTLACVKITSKMVDLDGKPAILSMRVPCGLATGLGDVVGFVVRASGVRAVSRAAD